MWIVRIALLRPYTFIVLAILILLSGILSIVRMPADIFPNINIPVVAAVWSYVGLPPEDMANRIVLISERNAQTTVNDVEHTESNSLTDRGIIKYFFQPNASEEMSYAQITGVSQSLLRAAPPGTTPPFILAYNASTVPILQLSLSSESLSESELFDIGNNIVRPTLGVIPGASMPFPYGGKQRQVQVDLNPTALQALGLTGQDVINAIAAQNLILPSGTQKVGDLEYFVGVNASPKNMLELNDIPIRIIKGAMIYVRDVANVHDGAPPQTNIVRTQGRHATLLTVLKSGNSSTLDVITSIKAQLPHLQSMAPPELKITPIGDQSIFVRAAISSVAREAVIAAVLTGLMIFLFLGSWRSTLIISVSIPLSILASIACLAALGQTLNIMTLGGLALAVGILVDDATVTIESINWHLEHFQPVEEAILNGAQQIALPALVSTLAICIVFIPMFMLVGIAKFLFVPLAEAVIFAMLTSYILSRTLVPTLAKYLLQPHGVDRPSNLLMNLQGKFEIAFDALRERYHKLLALALQNPVRIVYGFIAFATFSALLAFPIGKYLPGLGQDFFPNVDSGQIKLHLRARSGLRIEETAALCDDVEKAIHKYIPANEIDTIVDNIGLPYSGINNAYSTSAPVGPGDADIYITLKEGHHPTADYIRSMRQTLSADFPSTTFSFLPADIVSQTLNFGLPSPVDVQILGFNVAANRELANQLLHKLHAVPGLVDLRIQQTYDHPQLDVTINRSKAQLLGLTEFNVASNLLLSLAGSVQTQPSFWVDQKSGTQYSVVAQTPQYRLETPNALAMIPISNGLGGSGRVLADVASVGHSTSPAVVSHYDSLPVIDIFGTVQDTDLGYISDQVNRIVNETKGSLPRGTRIAVRGQVQTMKASFNGLLLGLVGAIILVYLLIVINFQSWIDPFIIITALPAALAGIVWMLFLTHTTVSVPALTGAIMCMGVSTANSVLVVSFARRRLDAGSTPLSAALEAGFSRFRPVLMTALAMVIGMIPMAIGIGDGGEQNAPLGRAVIGGLILATVATLFLVPALFKLIHTRSHQEAAV